MTAEYHHLYEDILTYCREYVSDQYMAKQRQRVRYWAALSILRCVLSSPMAARATLEKRRPVLDGRQNGVMPDDTFMEQLMDSADEDQVSDYVPTTPLDDPNAGLSENEIRRLNTFLKRADALAGQNSDAKIREAARTVSDLLDEGYHPIVYCRYISTAYYVAEHIQNILQRKHRKLHVKAVTGNEGDSEQRKEMVLVLAKEPVRVLVATDCLSEGINLQDHYNAVVHYDLPWNPNRLEQREGRVDRFGQSKDVVKTVLLYGANNEIDLVVLEVLLRKAKNIRQSLGISVPVPVESEQVVSTLVNNVLLRGLGQRQQQFRLALEDDSVSHLHEAWDQMADKEKKSRTRFAQHSIKPDEVSRELAEMEPVLGNAKDIQRFLANAVQRFNGELRPTRTDGVFKLLPGDLENRIEARDERLTFPMLVSFEGIPPPSVTLLGRNHPVIATAAEVVLAQALEGHDPRFARTGAIFTTAVQRRTAVLLLRLRYLIEAESQQFAEEIVAVAFRRDGDSLHWLSPRQEEALQLLRDARVTANMAAPERKEHVQWALGMLDRNWADAIVAERVSALEAAHARLRREVKNAKTKVAPHPPPDIIGCYVLVPTGATA